MKAVNIYYITIFSTLIALTACSNRPSYVMSDKKTLDVMYDMRLAKAMFSSFPDDFGYDEQKDALIESVLKKHKITQADLDSTLLWYGENTETYAALIDTLTARFERQNERLTVQAANAKVKERGGIYEASLPEFYILNFHTPTLRFNIDSSQMHHIDKERFRFSFDVKGIRPNHRIEATLYYRYKDTTVVDKKIIAEVANYSFIKPNLADSLLQGITGYVHLKEVTRGVHSVVLNNISNQLADKPELIAEQNDSPNGSEESSSDKPKIEEENVK